jgi:hypothetical protein
MVLIQKKYSRNKYWTSQELIWLTYNNKGESVRSNEGYWQVLLERKKKDITIDYFFLERIILPSIHTKTVLSRLDMVRPYLRRKLL